MSENTNTSETRKKVWFITGVSSGLGRIMAEKLLDQGDRVVGTARKVETLNDLQARYGDRFMPATLDVTETAAIRRIMEEAFRAFGHIDVIVSNAGYGLFGAAEELMDDQIIHQINTNLIGSIQVIRAALPHLRAQGTGRILQVSSEGGQIAYPNFSLYHATKWGIEGFVESVSQEVAAFGIEFTLVEPGPTRTNFGSGIVAASPMPVYGNTPSGEIRRAIAAGTFSITGDAAKSVQAMIDSTDVTPAPRRLLLGSDAYTRVHKALTNRVAALETQREIAFSTEIDA